MEHSSVRAFLILTLLALPPLAVFESVGKLTGFTFSVTWKFRKKTLRSIIFIENTISLLIKLTSLIYTVSHRSKKCIAPVVFWGVVPAIMEV